MTGAPGSGKSTTAAELARLLGAAVLDQDSMTNSLVDVVAEVAGVADYSDPRLAALTRDARYEALLRVAADCLRAHVPVVLIAPFTAERQSADAWAGLEGQLAQAGANVRLVWIRVDADVLAQRLGKRAAPRDRDKLSDLAGYVASLDLGPPRVAHIEVDGTLRPRGQAERIRASL